MEIQLVFFIAATILFSVTAWQARRSQRSPDQRTMFLELWALILVAFVGYALFGYLSITDTSTTDLASAAALDMDAQTRGRLAAALAVAAALVLWVLVYSTTLRERLRRWFPEPTTSEWDAIERPWPLQRRGFDPQSPIHAFALGIALLFLAQTLLEYILAGGQSGLTAENLGPSELLLSATLTALLLVTVTLTGVGLGQDRSWREALDRLGLRWPTLSELVMGVGIAGLLVAFEFCSGMVWAALTPEGVIQEQTQLNRMITGNVTSIFAAFLVALFSSIGEEVSFRGGLQPVIGLWPTTLLFALTHIQYQFTPGTLIILVVGAAFGWTRQHFGTVAAITAHFLYNFALLTLSIIARQLLGV